MSTLQIVVLALIQGLTEYLPVSSSAHLILVSALASWPDQGLVLDVATHLGTLIAVLIYFRAELLGMARSWMMRDADAAHAGLRRLSLFIALSSLPVLLAGWLAYDFVAGWLRDVRVIAVATVVFGLALLVGDRFFPRHRSLVQMRLRDCLAIGLVQAIALVPGASRSGVTIMMGRMLGFAAESAARYSFLLSIPVIAAAGLHGAYQLFSHQVPVSWSEFGLAVGVSALAGWVCIAAFLSLLGRIGLMPFIVYRLLLGATLVAIAF